MHGKTKLYLQSLSYLNGKYCIYCSQGYRKSIAIPKYRITAQHTDKLLTAVKLGVKWPLSICLITAWNVTTRSNYRISFKLYFLSKIILLQRKQIMEETRHRLCIGQHYNFKNLQQLLFMQYNIMLMSFKD